MKTFACFVLFFLFGVSIALSGSDSLTYIPKNLSEAHDQLMLLLSDTLKSEMKADRDSTLIGYHFGLGMWIRNNWGLWSGSRLAKYFDSLDIHHPDNMSGFILETFWYRLQERPVPFEEKLKRVRWQLLVSRTDSALMSTFCPIDSQGVFPKGRLLDPESESRVISYGYCNTHHLWAYELHQALFKPNKELALRINAMEEAKRIEVERLKQQFPSVIKLEAFLSRICKTSIDEFGTHEADSLIEFFGVYYETMKSLSAESPFAPVSDSLRQCGLDRLAKMAAKHPYHMHILLRMHEISDQNVWFWELAPAVLQNASDFTKVWQRLSKEEKSQLAFLLAPWDNVQLLSTFRSIAKTTRNWRTKALSDEIVYYLNLESEGSDGAP